MFQIMYNIILVLLLSTSVILPSRTSMLESLGCDPGEKDDCSKCYSTLANEVIISDKNRFNLQQAFFPTNGSNPVFVTVTYHFIRNATGKTNYSADGHEEVWFWTRSTFYLFQPIESLQFTSLFFSDLFLKIGSVDVYLQPTCWNTENNSTHVDRMRMLTQRVSS